MRYIAQTVFRDDDLMHFGVKGMKWGVRNKRQSTGTGRASASKPKASGIMRKALTGLEVAGAVGLGIYAGRKFANSSYGNKISDAMAKRSFNKWEAQRNAQAAAKAARQVQTKIYMPGDIKRSSRSASTSRAVSTVVKSATKEPKTKVGMSYSEFERMMKSNKPFVL